MTPSATLHTFWPLTSNAFSSQNVKLCFCQKEIIFISCLFWRCVLLFVCTHWSMSFSLVGLGKKKWCTFTTLTLAVPNVNPVCLLPRDSLHVSKCDHVGVKHLTIAISTSSPIGTKDSLWTSMWDLWHRNAKKAACHNPPCNHMMCPRTLGSHSLMSD